MDNAKPILFVLTAVAVLYILMHRFEFYPGDGGSRAYMLDRWTGSLEYIEGDERMPVTPPAKPATPFSVKP